MVGITIVLVSALASCGVSKSMNTSNTKLSELALANIEALAQNEEGGDDGCGTADPTRPIWDIEIKIGGSPISFPQIICRTGGCYKCSK